MNLFFGQLISGHDLAPLIFMLAVIAIPIVRILTRHQQTMTTLMQQQNQQMDPRVLQQVLFELQELRTQVSQLQRTLPTGTTPTPPPASLQKEEAETRA